jgi:hypothetical protein
MRAYNALVKAEQIVAAPAHSRSEAGEADPVVAVYLRDIDRTLIRQNLTLTVEHRLANLQALLAFADELRRAGKAARPA